MFVLLLHCEECSARKCTVLYVCMSVITLWRIDLIFVGFFFLLWQPDKSATE